MYKVFGINYESPLLKLHTKSSKLTQGVTKRPKIPYSDKKAELVKRSTQSTRRQGLQKTYNHFVVFDVFFTVHHVIGLFHLPTLMHNSFLH